MSTTSPKEPSIPTLAIGELTARELAMLAQSAPRTYNKLMAAERHQRRRDWADLIAQVIGHFAGLASLSILATVAWHALDLGDATQGAAIICTGAVSIVTVFVTGRLTSGRTKPTTHSHHTSGNS
jgi:hypothetical protein